MPSDIHELIIGDISWCGHLQCFDRGELTWANLTLACDAMLANISKFREQGTMSNTHAVFSFLKLVFMNNESRQYIGHTSNSNKKLSARYLEKLSCSLQQLTMCVYQCYLRLYLEKRTLLTCTLELRGFQWLCYSKGQFLLPHCYCKRPSLLAHCCSKKLSFTISMCVYNGTSKNISSTCIWIILITLWSGFFLIQLQTAILLVGII